MSLSAEGVDAVAIDRGRAPWAGRIGNRINDRILVFPQNLAGCLIEAEHSFHASRGLAFKIGNFDYVSRDVVSDKHAPSGHRRSGIAAGDGRAPKNLWATGRKFFEQALLTPDVVASGAHPLWPIIGAGRATDQQTEQNKPDKEHVIGSRNAREGVIIGEIQALYQSAAHGC